MSRQVLKTILILFGIGIMAFIDHHIAFMYSVNYTYPKGLHTLKAICGIALGVILSNDSKKRNGEHHLNCKINLMVSVIILSLLIFSPWVHFGGEYGDSFGVWIVKETSFLSIIVGVLLPGIGQPRG